MKPAVKLKYELTTGSAKRGRPGRPAWVDGVRHDSLQAAALALGVSRQSVRDALDAGGGTVKGRVISAAPPKPPAIPAAKKPAASRARAAKPDSPLALTSKPGPRAALLRYPPGEAPWNQGSKRWR